MKDYIQNIINNIPLKMVTKSEDSVLDPLEWSSHTNLSVPLTHLRLAHPCFQECVCTKGFLGGLDGKESACNAGDPGSVPGSGRSAGGGHGNPPKYSCLESPMDRGVWRATAHGITEHWTRLSA